MKIFRMKIFPLFCASLVAATTSISAIAQNQSPMNVVTKAPTVIETQKPPVISDFEWMDKSLVEQEITKINNLSQTKIGTPLRRNLSDLDTLQRLIDRGLVADDDYETQQAMGVVLGNVMQQDFPNTLEWKIYLDDLGRTRALCARKSSDCLFPITMLSRRMEAGIKPDVRKIYDDSIMRLEKHLPKLPYDGGIMYRLPR